jgi:hypothetical protein
MAWLGEVLPQDQQGGATPFAPRTNKDLIEEALFAQRRDLFSQLDLVFFDTTSIYFYGQGGETNRAGGKSVSLGRFKNCKPLNLKPLRHHDVEDKLDPVPPFSHQQWRADYNAFKPFSKQSASS